jgi:putative spermidine/putrescine transport system permease protein
MTHVPGQAPSLPLGLQNYERMATDALIAAKTRETMIMAFVVATISVAFAVPVAWWLSRTRSRFRTLAVVLLLSPLITNYVALVFGWFVVLNDRGLVNSVLGVFGVGPAPLLFNWGSVVVGLVHLALPFSALPLISAFANFDPGLEEAAAVLGATPRRRIRYVVLPLIAPGLAGAFMLAFAVAMSAFVYPLYLGNPTTLPIPLLIWQQVSANNYPMAATLAVLLFVLTVVGVAAVLLIGRQLLLPPRGLRPST